MNDPNDKPKPTDAPDEKSDDDEDEETSAELTFLDPATVSFRREGARLDMRTDGKDDWREVSLIRMFPLSEPESWISVVNEKGRELGVLKTLKGLEKDNLSLAREELNRRYLVPEIRAILSCRDRYDMVEWTVETDRGRVTFLTRNVRDKIKEPMPRRITLTDVEDNRYDIPDLDALDPASRQLLELRM